MNPLEPMKFINHSHQKKKAFTAQVVKLMICKYDGLKD